MTSSEITAKIERTERIYCGSCHKPCTDACRTYNNIMLLLAERNYTMQRESDHEGMVA